VILERRRIEQRLVTAHRPQISVNAHGFADAEQTAFRPLFRRRVVEFRQAYCAHQHSVSFARLLLGFSRKRPACLVDRDAAEQPFAQRQLMLPFFGHHAQYANGLSCNFKADPVTGQHEDVQIQSIVALLRRTVNGPGLLQVAEPVDSAGP
jgi:hypothetical protein